MLPGSALLQNYQTIPNATSIDDSSVDSEMLRMQQYMVELGTWEEQLFTSLGRIENTPEPNQVPVQAMPVDAVRVQDVEDRTNCSAIRGTAYNSEAERTFFLASCISPTSTPRPISPTVIPSQKPQAPILASGSIADAICALPWPCQEALYVAHHESGVSWAINSSSGACGPMQTLPCVGWGDINAHLAEAYRKWINCRGGSFYCAWYQWW